MQSVAVI